MDYIFRGRAEKFGSNINTDMISPPQYLELSVEEASKYAMSAVDPEFSSRVRPGDIFVAEENLGSGSSRETSPLSLKYLGISALVAKSYARIFYRNSINIGLPVVICPEADKIRMNDNLIVNLTEGTIKNESSGEVYKCSIIPPHIMEVISSGGLFNYIKNKVKGE